MRVVLPMFVLVAAMVWTTARPENPVRRPVRQPSRVATVPAPCLLACPTAGVALPGARSARPRPTPAEIEHAHATLDQIDEWAGTDASPAIVVALARVEDDRVRVRLVEAFLSGQLDADDDEVSAALARLASEDGPVEVRAGALAALECALRHELVDAEVRERLHEEASRRGL